PVVGVMTAPPRDEGIGMQKETDYGLTAGIHSLDPAGLGLWLDTVQAGNLYVNRGITGAIVQRQPFGGWKKSSIGAGTKAGGPNYLFGLGSWVPAHHSAPGEAITHAGVRALLAADDSLSGAFGSDAAAWHSTFGKAQDVSALAAERNVFRYLPVPVTIRLSEGAPLSELLRVVGAGLRAGSDLSVSTAVASDALVGIPVVVENDASWLARVPSLNPSRIRLIGGDHSALAAALGGRPDVAIYGGPVTPAGRIELLPFLREQAISITAHRFGTPNHLTVGLI
ncbi:MAG: aldehyde dehydrogenase family protein, partial [Candidatus Saccharibacteria bacterium]|nr:aldehyde dehydrogenase family protein [Microbacteriaceae bacterium]